MSVEGRQALANLIVAFERSSKVEGEYESFIRGAVRLLRGDGSQEPVLRRNELSAAIVDALTELSGKKPKKADLKKWRTSFRNSVFKRDKFTCKMCKRKLKEAELDAHHIYDRNDMPNGGYVIENGITLCKPCHEKAEAWHSEKNVFPGWYPIDLYRAIGSTYEKALAASRRLSDDLVTTTPS